MKKLADRIKGLDPQLDCDLIAKHTEEYIAELEAKVEELTPDETQSEIFKTAVTVLHIVCCHKVHGNIGEDYCCTYHAEEEVADTWNLPAHKRWTERFQSLLERFELNGFDAEQMYQSLLECQGVLCQIESSVSRRLLATLLSLEDRELVPEFALWAEEDVSLV